MTGTLSSESITKQERVRFAVMIENRSTSELTDVKLVGPPDSYEFDSIVLADKNEVRHVDIETFVTSKFLLFKQMSPGAHYGVWGYLKPTIAHSEAKLTLTATWTKGTSRAFASTTLGKNVVSSRTQNFFRDLSSFAKIFGVPLTAAILTFLINRTMKNREERAEISRQMLPQSFEYTSKYYLPLSFAAFRLRDSLNNNLPELAFYWVVHMETRMNSQRRAVGGFYFKDLWAERLVSQCWKNYHDALFGKDDTADFPNKVQACVVHMDGTEDFNGFAKKLRMVRPGIFGDRDAQEARNLFASRLIAVDKKTLHLDLQVLEQVIDYEANRPLEDWYGQKGEEFSCSNEQVRNYICALPKRQSPIFESKDLLAIPKKRRFSYFRGEPSLRVS